MDTGELISTGILTHTYDMNDCFYMRYNSRYSHNLEATRYSILMRTFVFTNEAITMSQKYTVDNYGYIRVNEGEFISLGSYDVTVNPMVDLDLVKGWNCIEIIYTDGDRGGYFQLEEGIVFNEHPNVLYCTAELPFDIVANRFKTTDYTNTIFRDLKIYSTANVDRHINEMRGVTPRMINTDDKINNITLKTANIVERPDWIPKGDDIYYLPLSENGSDTRGYIEPTINTAKFENGAMFVGNVIEPFKNSTWDVTGTRTKMSISVLDDIDGIIMRGGVRLYSKNNNIEPNSNYSEAGFTRVPISSICEYGVGITLKMRTTNIGNSVIAIYASGSEETHLKVDTSGKWKTYSVFFYGNYGIGQTVSIAARLSPNVILDISDVRVGNYSSSIPNQVGFYKCGFNLHESVGMDYSKDYTIGYFKKPLLAHDRSREGYSLDSMGRNDSTIGGSYAWWGKSLYTDNIKNAEPSSVITKEDYFDHWRYIVVRKHGYNHTITEYEFSSNKKFISPMTPSTIANAFVTQNDYDLLFGGWDNYAGICGSWYRDMIVAKRYLTDDEIELCMNKSMEFKKNKISLIGDIDECGVYNKLRPAFEIGNNSDIVSSYNIKGTITNNRDIIEGEVWYSGASTIVNNSIINSKTQTHIFKYRHMDSLSTQQLFSKRINSVSQGFEVQLNTDNVLNMYVNDKHILAKSIDIVDDNIYTVAIVIGTSSSKVYIGNQIYSSQTYQLMERCSSDLFIFSEINTGEPCLGKMSKYKFYDFALSDAEVKAVTETL